MEEERRVKTEGGLFAGRVREESIVLFGAVGFEFLLVILLQMSKRQKDTQI